MKVYNHFKHGFRESTYEKSLMIELDKDGFLVRCQFWFCLVDALLRVFPSGEKIRAVPLSSKYRLIYAPVLVQSLRESIFTHTAPHIFC